MGSTLICFTGIDGSGKTTLAKKLAGALLQEGIEAKYVYARYIPFLLKPFMLVGKYLFLRKENPNENFANYSRVKREATKKRKALSLVYQWLLISDYILQIAFKVWLPTIFGKSIICDRYIFDTLANDLAIDFNYSISDVDAFLGRWMQFIPKPQLIIFVDVPEEISLQRKTDIPSIDYLKERRPLLQHMAQKLGMFTIDGTNKLNELFEVVYHKASSCF